MINFDVSSRVKRPIEQSNGFQQEVSNRHARINWFETADEVGRFSLNTVRGAETQGIESPSSCQFQSHQRAPVAIAQGKVNVVQTIVLLCLMWDESFAAVALQGSLGTAETGPSEGERPICNHGTRDPVAHRVCSKGRGVQLLCCQGSSPG